MQWNLPARPTIVIMVTASSPNAARPLTPDSRPERPVTTKEFNTPNTMP